MRTILTKQQQIDWLESNCSKHTIEHKWSNRRYGSSRIFDGGSNLLGKASGYGYDRYGAALGDAIAELFPAELYRLAKRHCVGQRRTYKQPRNKYLYGLFFDSVKGRAWVDGGCGSQQIEHILNAIGFGLDYVGEHGSATGSAFYTLRPVSKHEREWLK